VHRTVLLVSRNKVSNRFLLGFWTSKCRVISHPILVTLLAPLKWSRFTGTPIYLLEYKIRSAQGELLEQGSALDEIERQFQKINAGKPWFTIDDDLHDRGEQVLEQLGIPPDSWWVVLHVREGAYHGVNGGPRVSDPLSYLDAAQAIIDRGGYVIRIGDSGTTPLPAVDGLVDYAHSSVKSDWMDIFVIGAARFLLGSISGPNDIARLFGVPAANANGVPMSQGLLDKNTMVIPKLLMSGSPPSALSFNKVLGSELFRDLHTRTAFDEAGITEQDNTPEEIRELAEEMMDRLDGSASYDATDNELHHQFKELVLSRTTPQTYGTHTKIGRHFLRTHADLFSSK
jgi:putative glycosyltransferase (TIGR04372 family)